MVETAHAQWKIAKIDEKQRSRYIGKRVAEFISSDRFTTRSRINAPYCACADIIVMFETDGIG